jgi:hypothetical protein
MWRGTITIRNSHFVASDRDTGFGGVLALRGFAEIEKSDSINNRAPNGVAIWFAEGKLSIHRCRFEGNVATDLGGGIGIADGTNAQVSICYSHFRNNNARFGVSAVDPQQRKTFPCFPLVRHYWPTSFSIRRSNAVSTFRW